MRISRINWNVIGRISAYAISIILILFVFISNRPLFLDSLNLALNVVEGTFSDLSKPLKYQQSAPILFLYITKFFTLIFGSSEYTFRLLPLISGLACLGFFGSILNRFVQSKYAIIGIFWLGTHSIFIRYSTEFKQYITDAFVCAFLIWMALRIKTLNKRNVLFIGLVGAVSIWMSMPSIFVLLGLLFYYSLLQLKSQNSQYPILLLATWFLINFILEYYLILSPAIESDHMQNFHSNYFLQGKIWNLESIQHDFGLIESTLRIVVGKSTIAITTAMILIILSTYEFIKTKNSFGLLLVVPILAVFGASALGKYSLIERLMIFTVPLIMILILRGIQYVAFLLKTKSKWLKYMVFSIILLAFTVGIVQTQGLKYFITPLEIEDNKSALIHIAQHKENTKTIVCSQFAYPAYSYYKSYDINYTKLKLGNAIAAKHDESLVQLAYNQCYINKDDIWILMGHMIEEEITNLILELEKVGTIKNSYRTKCSAAILFSTQ